MNVTIQGEPIKPFVEDLVKKVENHSKIEVFKNATFTNLSGHVAHFKGTILNGDSKDIEFVAAIIATGGAESKPKEYLFGESKAVETQHSLEERIIAGDPSLKNIKNAVFIQCVGSRDEERPYCSKVCCSGSVRLAGRLREINPTANIYILFRDLRTYGLLEKFYTEARKAGIIFGTV